MSARLDQLGLAFIAILIVAAILVPVLSLAVSPNSPFYLPPYVVQLLGKYLCYAILAVALDLVWGYCGILSLGHGAFFALGGYAMGMYLMRQIGTRGVYANPILPDFMVFLNWKELPVAWWGFNWFPYAMLMVVLVPGLLALAFGWFAFRSRVTGVYLSIITQAMTFALFKEFFRNDFGFGGNNGLTDFKDLLGFSLQTAVDEGRSVLGERHRADPRLRRLARDHRLEIWQGADGGARRRKPHALPRLSGRELQAVRLRRLGDHRRRRRRALCAASRHHQPQRIRARKLDRSGDLGCGRRPRNADRRGDRRNRRQLRQDLFHRRLPRILALRSRPAVRPDHPVPAQGHARIGAQGRERPQPRPVVPVEAVEEGVEP